MTNSIPDPAKLGELADQLRGIAAAIRVILERSNPDGPELQPEPEVVAAEQATSPSIEHHEHGFTIVPGAIGAGWEYIMVAEARKRGVTDPMLISQAVRQVKEHFAALSEKERATFEYNVLTSKPEEGDESEKPLDMTRVMEAYMIAAFFGWRGDVEDEFPWAPVTDAQVGEFFHWLTVSLGTIGDRGLSGADRDAIIDGFSSRAADFIHETGLAADFAHDCGDC